MSGIKPKMMTITKAPRRGSLKFESFISLVLQRNYDAIQKAFSSSDFDINKEDFRGVTVLHYAAELEDVELIKMILLQMPKAKINAKTLEMMSTPLMIAAGNGKSKAIEVLLQYGADASCQNALGYTALMIATEANNIDCVNVLLDSNVNCNVQAQNYKGLNAIMLAGSNLEITEKVIGMADLSQVDSEGNSILHHVCNNGKIENLNLVLAQKKLDINLQNYKGETPLHCAIRGKNLKIADILIETGASLKEQDLNGLNAFQYAAIYDETGTFLDQNVCPEYEIEKVFITAAEHGRLHVLEKFINKIGENDIISSLLLASREGHLNCLKLLCSHYERSDENILIDAGIEALSTNKFKCFEYIYNKLNETSGNIDSIIEDHGNLVISTAFTSGCLEACELFLQQGVDPNGMGSETFLMAASANGHFDVVKLLIRFNADINQFDEKIGSALLLATINNHAEIVSYLLENRADTSISDESGFTPLLSAAYYGYTEVFMNIFKFDKNIKQRSKDGLTPLLAACISGKIEIVELLIENDADITEIDDMGNNCLHCSSEDLKGFGVLLFLVNQIDDLELFRNSKNKNGKTPLDLVISHGNQSILFSLLASKPEIETFLIAPINFKIDCNEDNEMCLICRDDFVLEDAASKLPCGHLFHEYCYGEWSITKPNCPYCQMFPFKVKKVE